MNFPSTPFFGDEELGPRIMPVFGNNNITDENEMNEYLQSATPAVNKLVEKKL